MGEGSTLLVGNELDSHSHLVPMAALAIRLTLEGWNAGVRSGARCIINVRTVGASEPSDSDDAWASSAGARTSCGLATRLIVERCASTSSSHSADGACLSCMHPHPRSSIRRPSAGSLSTIHPPSFPHASLVHCRRRCLHEPIPPVPAPNSFAFAVIPSHPPSRLVSRPKLSYIPPSPPPLVVAAVVELYYFV